MCRNIKPLYNFEPPTTDDEIRAAAIQFVRKISGFQKASSVNELAFEHAVEEIAKSSRKLLESLITNAPPKDREIEMEKAKERNKIRFGNQSTA
ncbi:MAG: DUF2277 domain-containing protein [Acidobacteriota bacterium]